jgi:hypothetical protein
MQQAMQGTTTAVAEVVAAVTVSDSKQLNRIHQMPNY